jgi:hypothetical protein
MDATIAEPEPYRETWAAVLLDEVHLYSSVQQHAAFTWFVNAQTHQRWVLAAGDLRRRCAAGARRPAHAPGLGPCASASRC